MKIIGIIPARMESSRLPGKPLIKIDGKTMIQRVYESVNKSMLFDKVTPEPSRRLGRDPCGYGTFVDDGGALVKA